MDMWLFELINGTAGKAAGLDAFMRFLSTFGIVIAIAAVFLLFFVKKQSWGILGFLSFFLALGVNRLLKITFDRPRPFMEQDVVMLLEKGDSPSFPSDQAVIAGVFTFILFLLHKRMGMAAFFFSCLILYSRVYVGHHYPSDVIAGFLLGLALAFITHSIWAHLRRNTGMKTEQSRHFP